MSIKVTYKPSNAILVNVECKNVEEVFQQIGNLQEVIGNNMVCGKCGGTQVRLVHRKAGGKHGVNELLCETVGDNGYPCNHKLEMGKNEDHELFPRRYAREKDSDGNVVPKRDADGKKEWLPNNGWVRWDSKANDGEGGYV